jgi:two-component system, LuxR family, sensor kinase FixL
VTRLIDLSTISEGLARVGGDSFVMGAVLFFFLLLVSIATVLALIFTIRRRFVAKSFEIDEANRRFQATFEQAAVGVAHIDARGRWLRLNDRFCEIIGYDRDELLTRSFQDITHPDDLAHDLASQEALLSGRHIQTSTEKRYIRKDGRIVWVNTTRSIVRDGGGRPDFVVSVIEDITSRKEAEARLVTGEAQYSAIFDSAVEAMAVIDSRGSVQSVNPAVEKIFGYTPAEMIGGNIKMLMPAAVAQEHDHYLERYRTTGERAIIGIGREVTGQRKDGTLFPLDLSVAEWQRDGETYFTGIMRDISARKDAEDALVASEESLRLLQNEFAHLARVNDLGEMAAAIAHEINQPLTAIVNYLNAGLFMAVDGYSETHFAETEQVMRLASEQALRAGEIVRRLREFVGQGNGERTVERAEQLVDSAMALALIGARAGGISIEREAGVGDAELQIDAVQMQQVLVNLLRNAVESMEANPRRRPSRLTVATAAAADDMIEISVADTGPGIAPALRHRLFEPFVTTKSKGMGMGLSVCRRLIEAHGGTIDASDNMSGGATFSFKLPRFRSNHG